MSTILSSIRLNSKINHLIKHRTEELRHHSDRREQDDTSLQEYAHEAGYILTPRQ
jgi:hypothetical protein